MAAGLGFIEFSTGDVLSAAAANGYLASQTVMVFANAAARTSAITSPQEGMFSFLKDTDVTQYYNGTAWTNLDTTGMVNPMTTTGDTIFSSSGSTPARRAIGTTGQVLTVSGGLPVWATPAAATGSFVFINRTTFSNVASQAIDDVFSSTYQKYLVTLDNMSAATSNDDPLLQFRYAGPTTQTTAYYSAVQTIPFSGTTSLIQVNNGSAITMSANTGGSSNEQGSAYLFFNNVGISNVPTVNINYTSGQLNFYNGFGAVNTARTYTGFLLRSASTNITGTVTVYGLANS